MTQIEPYTVDLAKIRGSGELKCPKCGILISPDDQTENAYTILETVMNADIINKIILQCKKCKSHIHLTGFHVLKK